MTNAIPLARLSKSNVMLQPIGESETGPLLSESGAASRMWMSSTLVFDHAGCCWLLRLASCLLSKISDSELVGCDPKVVHRPIFNRRPLLGKNKC